LITHPDNPRLRLRGHVTVLISDQWFNSPQPVTEPEFCEHLAMFLIDEVIHERRAQRRGLIILFGILRSPECRKHIVPRSWSMLTYRALAEKELESFRCVCRTL
jgi:hypothetical protein